MAKKESMWSKVKKRAADEVDRLKNKPSAFANDKNADKNVAYEKKKRKKD